jgi:rhodanese-related sulfurtransferase
MRRIGAIFILVALALGGCASPSPTPVPPTATSVPPTATRVSPTATLAPVPTTAMQMPTTAASKPMSPTVGAPKLGKISVGNSFYTNISPDELKAMLDKKDSVLINVHTPYFGEIADTNLFIPFNELEKNLDKLPQDKNAKLVLYCRTSMMSTPASEALVKLGFTNVFNLAGGMNAWTEKQYPLLNKPK